MTIFVIRPFIAKASEAARNAGTASCRFLSSTPENTTIVIMGAQMQEVCEYVFKCFIIYLSFLKLFNNKIKILSSKCTFP